MAAKTNSEILMEAYGRWDACKGCDIELWHEYIHDDLVLHSMAEGQHGLDFSAPRNGREELRGYLKELTNLFEMEHWTLKETISQGDRVVGLGVTAWTCRTTGKRVETPVAVVCTFRDGKICEYHEFYDSAAVAAAAC